MNKGIRIATGDWIYFLGSDDTLYDKNVLRNIFEIIAGCNCDVLYGNVFTSISKKIYNGEFTREMLFNENICHQSIFLKKSIFDKIGLFNLKYKVFADWDSNFKWFYNNNIRHKYYNVIVANYSEDGMSNTIKDYPFLRDRLGLIIKYGCKSLPLNTTIHIAEIACIDSKKEKRYFEFFKYSVNVFFLKSFRKLKNLV